MMLTLQLLKDMTPGAIIASGVCLNHPDDIYMTNNRVGDQMNWIAKRGNIHDWCIYVDWVENGINHCLTNGNKVTSDLNIKRLVPCDDAALQMYRK